MAETNLSHLLWNLLNPHPNRERQDVSWKDFFFYSVSLYTQAVAQHVWQACRAQPPESSALLFHRQAIKTVNNKRGEA